MYNWWSPAEAHSRVIRPPSLVLPLGLLGIMNAFCTNFGHCRHLPRSATAAELLLVSGVRCLHLPKILATSYARLASTANKHMISLAALYCIATFTYEQISFLVAPA